MYNAAKTETGRPASSSKHFSYKRPDDSNVIYASQTAAHRALALLGYCEEHAILQAFSQEIHAEESRVEWLSENALQETCYASLALPAGYACAE